MLRTSTITEASFESLDGIHQYFLCNICVFGMAVQREMTVNPNFLHAFQKGQHVPTLSFLSLSLQKIPWYFQKNNISNH